MKHIQSHISHDGTSITFTNFNGSTIGYAGWAGFIASIVHSLGWRAYGSPSQGEGYFIALPSPYIPEDLPIDAGFDGWRRLSIDDLLEFIGTDE